MGLYCKSDVEFNLPGAGMHGLIRTVGIMLSDHRSRLRVGRAGGGGVHFRVKMHQKATKMEMRVLESEQWVF